MSRDDASATKMKRKTYEKELHQLQVQLCHLQEWVKAKGLRVIIVLEGRDAAGKGGTIKAITERVSPRVFRVVALPAPSDREKGQMYMQRYVGRKPLDIALHVHLALLAVGRRRNRDLRPELVQPRRRRIRHGLLLAQAAQALSRTLPDRREIPHRERNPAHQDLAGGRRRGA